jgi:GNAT superfamily N-acetyltransferase
METTIRPATPQDKKSLTQMRNALQHHSEASNPHIWRLTKKGRPRIPDQVDEMLNDPDGLALIAEEEGTPIGFAYGRVTRREDYAPAAVGFINLIYVREGHRRRGTGTRMVRRLTDFFRSRDAEEANLGYIKGNTQGENFWKKLGFTTVRVTVNTPIDHLENRLSAQP